MSKIHWTMFETYIELSADEFKPYVNVGRIYVKDLSESDNVRVTIIVEKIND